MASLRKVSIAAFHISVSLVLLPWELNLVQRAEVLPEFLIDDATGGLEVGEALSDFVVVVEFQEVGTTAESINWRQQFSVKVSFSLGY